MCLSVCLLSVRVLNGKRLQLAIKTQYTLGILHDTCSARIDPDVKKIKGQGHKVIRCDVGVGLQDDSTAHFLS